MEYLMTYGWAILIIAVVLGALFQLGIFNASTFTPKAPPGACHVFRPNGPMTTSFINLQGICNGELPQYAAQFDGQYSQVRASAITPAYVSVAVWVNIRGAGTYPRIVSNLAQTTPTWTGFEFYQGLNNYQIGTQLNAGGTFYNVNTGTVTQNTWNFIAFTYDGSHIRTYFNGVIVSNVVASGTIGYAATPTPTYIGDNPNMALSIHGSMANIQIYNSSLSSNEITALYNEGIGGAPIKLNNLVGWWPLNGDVKDYSGNNNNGVASYLSFTSNWGSGYSAP